MSHYKIHLLDRYSHTASGPGLPVPHAVQEYGRTQTRRTFIILTDVKAVLVLIRIVNDMLTVIHIKIGVIPYIHELVIHIRIVA